MRSSVPLLVCPFLAGCLAFGYPAISATPEIALPDTDVHAFRVCSDVTMSGPWMTGPIAFGRSVDEIPVMEAAVSPQRDAYFAYYYLLLPIASGSHTRDLEVLLYRPGFETVAIPARPWWQGPGNQRLEKIAWKEAPDLLAQKAALDKIYPANGRPHLSKEARAFVAREYARLADSPLAATPAMAATRQELLDLAKQCQE